LLSLFNNTQYVYCRKKETVGQITLLAGIGLIYRQQQHELMRLVSLIKSAGKNFFTNNPIIIAFFANY